MQNFGVTNKEHYGMLCFFSEVVNIERGVLYCKQKSATKLLRHCTQIELLQGTKESTPLPLPFIQK